MTKRKQVTLLMILLLGSFCLVGGLIGFLRADSYPSLIIGSLSGALLFFSAYLMKRRENLGWLIALSVAFLLDIRFSLALIKAFKVMPHLLMVIMSSLLLLSLLSIAPWGGASAKSRP